MGWFLVLPNQAPTAMSASPCYGEVMYCDVVSIPDLMWTMNCEVWPLWLHGVVSQS
jgi:hypothetical protein